MRFLDKKFIENIPPFAYSCKYVNHAYSKRDLFKRLRNERVKSERESKSKESDVDDDFDPAPLNDNTLCTHYTLEMRVLEYNKIDEKWIVEPFSAWT